mgnify:CR=1 FL=1
MLFRSLVSSLTTPSPYIKKKQGMDYVEYSYMREVADKEFPGWSWTIIKTEVLGSEAYVVHGRLKWFDEGIWREGDMCAAHRIQKKRGVDDLVTARSTEPYVTEAMGEVFKPLKMQIKKK